MQPFVFLRDVKDCVNDPELSQSISAGCIVVHCALCFTSSVQRGVRYKGPTKARHARQSEVVLPFAVKHVGRGKVCVSKNKPRDRSNMEREERLDGSGVADSFKNKRLRGRTVLELNRASY